MDEFENKDRALGLMVVDNELAIAKLLHIFFTRKGFSVWMTASSRAALELYRDHMTEIDLVLSDVVMPEMDGLHLLAEVRQLNPAVRFCFMSGESAEYSQADLFAAGADRVYPKPFPSLEQMATDLHQLATSPRPVCDVPE